MSLPRGPVTCDSGHERESSLVQGGWRGGHRDRVDNAVSEAVPFSQDNRVSISTPVEP